MQEYTICVKEPLDPYWQEWFESLHFSSQENGETLLIASIPDQAALHSILKKIHNLGLTLISINRIEKTSRGNS